LIPRGVEVFVGLDPIDLRWSFDTLTGIVADRIGREVRSGAVFVFFGKRRTALKLIYVHAGGLCIFYKRLDKGTFRVPEPSDPQGSTVVISEGALDDLLDGLDIEAKRTRSPARVRFH